MSEPKLKGIADITFLVDSTGSMKPCIGELQQRIAELGANLSAGNPVDWRARVIGFRDLDCTDAEPFVGRDVPFVSTASELKAQADRLEAKGGGIGEAEIPESGLDALWVAMTTGDWRPIGTTHRIIVVLTDAPAKPEMKPETVGDPNRPRDKGEVAKLAADEHFKLHLYAPSSEVWDFLGKVPGAFHEDVAKGQTPDVYLGLRQVKWDKIVELINKTISSATPQPVQPPPPVQPSSPSQPLPPVPVVPGPEAPKTEEA